MQDRFKFRAWNTVTQEMKEVTQLTLDKGQTASMCEVKGKITVHAEYQPHIILMQCTGIKDKNKNFVYEGDIVKLFDEVKLDDEDFEIYEIRFMQEFCGFCLYSKNFVSDFGGLHPTDIEVIGNKYENPELLKGKEDEN